MWSQIVITSSCPHPQPLSLPRRQAGRKADEVDKKVYFPKLRSASLMRCPTSLTSFGTSFKASRAS